MTNDARSLTPIALLPNLSTRHALSLTPSFSWGRGVLERLEPLQRFPGCLSAQARCPETAKAVPKHRCRLHTPIEAGC
jgi:hypothetical protein